MLENNWKDSAPKVPQEFHERFEETLRQIEETTISDNKRKNKKIRIRVLTVAAALCACMTVTVAAKEFLKWNVVLKERLNPSEEQQKSLEETNYIQNVNQSETHNGVTVALSDSLDMYYILYYPTIELSFMHSTLCSKILFWCKARSNHLRNYIWKT